MRYVFIVNPTAGDGGNAEKIKAEVKQLPEQAECEVYLTENGQEATAFVRKYCEEHDQETIRFIACGGDGTINAVVNGIAEMNNAQLAVYPCGSGNDLVKAVGGQKKYRNIAKLLKGRIGKFDLLKAGDHYAANAVHFGFDTAVAMTVNEGRAKKGHAGKNLYTLGIIKALLRHMKNRFKVYADDELLDPEGVALLCTLCNGQYVGGSFRCAPRSHYDDGLIEVCLVKPVPLWRFIRLISVYVKGEHLDDPSLQDILVYRQARKVRVEAPEGFAFSLDGEIIYENVFTVEVKNNAIDFVFID